MLVTLILFSQRKKKYGIDGESSLHSVNTSPDAKGL